MRIQDFVIEFQQAPQRTVIELHRTYCACHWKEVWVADFEPLPYLCHRLKELPHATL